MIETIAKVIVVIGFTCVVALSIFFVHKARQMMQEELEREKLRRQTLNAFVTDKRLEKMRRNGMRAHYRRARIW